MGIVFGQWKGDGFRDFAVNVGCFATPIVEEPGFMCLLCSLFVVLASALRDRLNVFDGFGEMKAPTAKAHFWATSTSTLLAEVTKKAA